MKKLLIALVVLFILGLLCTGVLTLVGGGAWFYLGQQADAQFEAIGAEIEAMEALEAAEAALAGQEIEAEAAAEAAAEELAEEPSEDDLTANEAETEPEEVVAEEAAAPQAANPAPSPRPRPRARPAPAPEPEPEPVEVVSEDEWNEDEELNLDDLDALLEDDDPLGDIEILDDDPDEKGRRGKRRGK
jgi:outer membrane biosynthesis protein TonB